MKKNKKKSAEIIDKKFEHGDEVLDFFDTTTINRPNQSHRINLELPQWMLQLLDIESARLGVPRQAVIKFILDEKFKKVS
jgi:hypothetical protein